MQAPISSLPHSTRPQSMLLRRLYRRHRFPPLTHRETRLPHRISAPCRLLGPARRQTHLPPRFCIEIRSVRPRHRGLGLPTALPSSGRPLQTQQAALVHRTAPGGACSRQNYRMNARSGFCLPTSSSKTCPRFFSRAPFRRPCTRSFSATTNTNRSSKYDKMLCRTTTRRPT